MDEQLYYPTNFIAHKTNRKQQMIIVNVEVNDECNYEYKCRWIDKKGTLHIESFPEHELVDTLTEF